MIDDAPAHLTDAARAFIDRAVWTFAVTYGDHWYVVRNKPRRDYGHEALYELIRDYHVKRRWGGSTWRSVDIGGWSYWIVDGGTVINRKPGHLAGWDDQPAPPADWLPAEYRRDMGGTERWWSTESDYFGIDPDSGVQP